MTQHEDVHMTDLSSSTGGGHREDEDRKLFLGGLSWDTEERDILDYFSQFGEVSSVSIKYDTVTGKPRGFGFVTFQSVAPIEAVLHGGPHVIRNRAVDPKRPRAKPMFKKIFVGGIDADMAEDDIKNYFCRFGNVTGVELPFDRQRGRRREFCFIIFDSEGAAEAAINEPKQMIGGKECDIRIAQPQRFPRTDGGQSTRGGAGGGGAGVGSRSFGTRPQRTAQWGGTYNGVSSGGWGNRNADYGGGFVSFGGQPFRKTYTNSNYYPENY